MREPSLPLSPPKIRVHSRSFVVPLPCLSALSRSSRSSRLKTFVPPCLRKRLLPASQPPKDSYPFAFIRGSSSLPLSPIPFILSKNLPLPLSPPKIRVHSRSFVVPLPCLSAPSRSSPSSRLKTFVPPCLRARTLPASKPPQRFVSIRVHSWFLFPASKPHPVQPDVRYSTFDFFLLPSRRTCDSLFWFFRRNLFFFW